MNTVERATGRWRQILPQLGISASYLVNRHGPCPLCGGKDRFRWDDRDGSGSYYCGQCGPGPGILLVRKINGWDHATACGAIDDIIGKDPPPREHPQPDRRRSNCGENILAQASNSSIVRHYLGGRGLSTFPSVLRGISRLAYVEGDRFIGHFPAMIAPVASPDGELRSVHRTYIGDVPTRKKLLSAVGTGAAIRLFEPTDELGIAEGIETAIAAHEIFGLPTWATISATIMEGFTPPTCVRRLTIYADHDATFAGQRSAFVLAHRLHRDLKIEIVVKVPQMPGDWLDVLNSQRAVA